MKSKLWTKAIEETNKSKEKYDRDFLAKVKDRTFNENDMYDLLKRYSVLRNFKRKSKPKDLVLIKKFLFKHGYKKNICAIEVVNLLIKLIIKEYGFVGTSAASKLLYQFYPEKVRIYDTFAVKALEAMGEKGIKSNYEFYVEAWNRQIKVHLPKIESELRKYTSDRGTVYRLRVFDKYLWLAGQK